MQKLDSVLSRRGGNLILRVTNYSFSKKETVFVRDQFKNKHKFFNCFMWIIFRLQMKNRQSETSAKIHKYVVYRYVNATFVIFVVKAPT
jgi:hypothetical protein